MPRTIADRDGTGRRDKACKRVERGAKRKLTAQPEISHEAAEQILRNQATRTDDNFLCIIHVSRQLALLRGHANVFFCRQCGAINAGTPRVMKSLCDGLANLARKRDANSSVV